MTPLQQEYLGISKGIVSILDNIKENVEQYPDYLGWLDLKSPLLGEPEILFVGINPGPGRFILWNRNNWDGKAKRLLDPSKKLIPEDFPCLWRSRLQWFAFDNARKKGEWWDLTKEKRNHYPYYMCELLVRIYRHEFPATTTTRQELTEIIEKRVMDTNLFPMSTQNIQGLNSIIRKHDKENHSGVRDICHKHIRDLVKLTKPRCVVLLGAAVYHELSNDLKEMAIPFYCVNRQLGWHSEQNIKRMADDIYDLIHKSKSK
ncbi:MAG: hypothetical protein IJV44_05175 [Prevotella sp.]|nr:hypothetical protein [Prevotella sp.]